MKKLNKHTLNINSGVIRRVWNDLRRRSNLCI